MARIDRKTQLIFGNTAGATGITEYGSPAAGSAVFSTDLDNIQTPAWLSGWSAAALAGNEIPTFQDFNAIHFVATSQIAYLFQEGLPAFDTGTTYYTNSIVKKPGTYEIYGSLINDNSGNALPNQANDVNWQYLGNLADLVAGDSFGSRLLHIQDEKANGTDGGSSAAGVNTRQLNNVVVNQISGAALSSNQVTLPIGDYIVFARSKVVQTGSVIAYLFDTTGVANLIIGDVADSDGQDSVVHVSGPFSLSAESVIELRNLIQSTNSGNGLGEGYNGSTSIPNIYSDVMIWKVG